VGRCQRGQVPPAREVVRKGNVLASSRHPHPRGGEIVMLDQPSITILFDPETRIPERVLINGQTDQQTAKLLVVADRMLEAIREANDVQVE